MTIIMQILLILSCLQFAISLSAAAKNEKFHVKISPARVTVQNVTFSPTTTQLECSSSVKHNYCCWSSSINDCESCETSGQDCAVPGMTVSSDGRKCTATIQHGADNVNIAGQLSCRLIAFDFTQKPVKTEMNEASTNLFIVNLSEVPLIQQIYPTTTIEFFEANDTKEAQFECASQTKAPVEEYQWFFKESPLPPRLTTLGGKRLRYNLTREDFNQSLKCVITKKIDAENPLGTFVAVQDMVMNLNPVFLEIHRRKEANYEVLLESWPMPSFVRISSVEMCDKQCIIYRLADDGKYVMDKSPSSVLPKDADLVRDVVVKGQVYGAKTRIDLLLNPGAVEAGITEIYVDVGNSLNVAKAKINLLESDPYYASGSHRHLTSSEANTQQSNMTLVIVAVSLTVLALLLVLVLVIVYRRRISESFKCGVYLVPHDEEDPAEKQSDKDDKKKPLTSLEEKTPPETEF